MTRSEEIRQAAYQYGVLYAKYEIYQEDSSFIAGAEWADTHPTIFNHCINKQSPDYIEGYEQGRKDANPEIAYLEHEIEILKSKLQAADDLNTLLTAELEKAKSPWISVEDRLPEDDLIFELVAVKLKDYPGWYRGYYRGTWHYIDECCDKIRAFDVTHWMPIPELLKGGEK